MTRDERISHLISGMKKANDRGWLSQTDYDEATARTALHVYALAIVDEIDILNNLGSPYCFCETFQGVPLSEDGEHFQICKLGKALLARLEAL